MTKSPCFVIFIRFILKTNALKTKLQTFGVIDYAVGKILLIISFAIRIYLIFSGRISLRGVWHVQLFELTRRFPKVDQAGRGNGSMTFLEPTAVK